MIWQKGTQYMILFNDTLLKVPLFLYKVVIKDKIIILSHTAWQNININHKIFLYVFVSPHVFSSLHLCANSVTNAIWTLTALTENYLSTNTHSIITQEIRSKTWKELGLCFDLFSKDKCKWCSIVLQIWVFEHLP